LREDDSYSVRGWLFSASILILLTFRACLALEIRACQLQLSFGFKHSGRFFETLSP